MCLSVPVEIQQWFLDFFNQNSQHESCLLISSCTYSMLSFLLCQNILKMKHRAKSHADTVMSPNCCRHQFLKLSSLQLASPLKKRNLTGQMIRYLENDGFACMKFWETFGKRIMVLSLPSVTPTTPPWYSKRPFASTFLLPKFVFG